MRPSALVGTALAGARGRAPDVVGRPCESDRLSDGNREDLSDPDHLGLDHVPLPKKLSKFPAYQAWSLGVPAAMVKSARNSKYVTTEPPMRVVSAMPTARLPAKANAHLLQLAVQLGLNAPRVIMKT